MLIASFLEYLAIEKKYSKHTVMAYKKDLTSFQEFCLEQFENEEIAALDYHQIRLWIVALVDSGISNRTINRKVSSLKTFYGFLQKIGSIQRNPLAKHKSLKVQQEIHTPFTEKEINEVLGLLRGQDDFESLRDRLIIELLYSTGIRRAELINLKENDINRSDETIKVLGKRNKERLVVLLPSVALTLDAYIESKKSLGLKEKEGYLLLTKRGVKIYETLVYRVINLYFSTVSTRLKKSPHVLRHAFATHLLNNGAALNSVKELLGHSSLASTQVYTHNSLEKLKKVFNKAHPREPI